MNSWQTTTTIWMVAVLAIAGAMTGAVAWRTGGLDGEDQVARASQEVAEDQGHVVDEAHGADDAHEAVETDGAEDEQGDHDHSAGMVDPDAPEVEIEAVEFAYDVSSLEIEAGLPVTIALRNHGMLEHDITIEGFEHLGVAHAQPGEEAAFTVSIDQPGEYRYYCTVPGHLEAGMEGLLTVR